MKRAGLLLLYGVLCALELLVSWAKEHVETAIKGKKEEETDER